MLRRIVCGRAVNAQAFSFCFRDGVKEINAAKSMSAKKAKESELGFRDSVLLHLPYFNIIRQTIVDPMHNLFSGILLRPLKINVLF